MKSSANLSRREVSYNAIATLRRQLVSQQAAAALVVGAAIFYCQNCHAITLVKSRIIVECSGGQIEHQFLESKIGAILIVVCSMRILKFNFRILKSSACV